MFKLQFDKKSPSFEDLFFKKTSSKVPFLPTTVLEKNAWLYHKKVCSYLMFNSNFAVFCAALKIL